MLTITIPEGEQFDERTNEFIAIKEQTIQLEHSLVSISKWESKWQKAFLDRTKKSFGETIDYVRCMTLTKNVDPNVYMFLTAKNLKDIESYINDPMTATTFSNRGKSSRSNEIITSEVIYYQMIALGIPVEFQKWHLNRLLTLIKVCNIKNQPPKKMSKREIMSRNAALNEARRKQLGTRG